MTSLVTQSIADLAEILGPLPPGDIPAAWWMSLDEEVLGAYEAFRTDHEAWRERMNALYEISGLKTPSAGSERIRIGGLGHDYLVGLVPPQGLKQPPRWWRVNAEGLLVPRKRTKAEKTSPVNVAFAAARAIPRATDYLPGVPNALWLPSKAMPVHARRTGQAVLVFVGADPDKANPRFEMGPQWSRMKLSTFHMLRERQAAAGASG